MVKVWHKWEYCRAEKRGVEDKVMDDCGGTVGSHRRIVRLVDIVYSSETVPLRENLEAYRIQYEAAHGPTDLTRHYTSMLAPEAQDWLINNEPERWMDGLPPFIKSYLTQQLENYAKTGELDTLLDKYVRLYSGMKAGKSKGGGGRSR